MYNIPAIILAGGKSRRMGRDKALLPFRGYSTLSEFQYVKLQRYFHPVYLSTKEEKFPFPCKLIQDTSVISSPLVALVSLFETLEEENIFVLSVDTPLVNKDVIDALYYAQDKAYDAIVARHTQGSEPLCAIYNRSIVQRAKEAIAKEKHALHKLLDNSKVKYVYFNDSTLFTNLNYPEEYDALLLS